MCGVTEAIRDYWHESCSFGGSNPLLGAQREVAFAHTAGTGPERK
jgi:hypothetical protein